jgi:hypothetical protein
VGSVSDITSVRSLFHCITEICLIVISQGTLGVTALNGFATFTVVKVNWQIPARITVESAVIATASIDKDFMFVHVSNLGASFI